MEITEVCETTYIDEKKVKKVQAKMPTEKAVETMAAIFNALGDNTRLKILYALSKEELCVCDVSSLLGNTVSAVSHQLRVLRNLRLVKSRTQRKIVYYSLIDDHVLSLLKVGVKHAEES